MSVKKWSQYFQNPSFLELTRKKLIFEEYRPLIVKWCGITDNARILDVGCGTGYFTRFIGESELRIELIGIDNDDAFINEAEKNSHDSGRYQFIQGDALELPFADNEFDAVVSHTFLTTVSDTGKAFSEMKRVCKNGGIISSVTPMSLTPLSVSPGKYPDECVWLNELRELFNKMWQAYEKVNSFANYLSDLSTADIPRFFSEQGMENVCAYPIGKLFSFSNGCLSLKDREEFIELYKSSEIQRLDEYIALEEFRKLFTDDDAKRYKELLNEKCDFLSRNITENSIWEWNGGANVLVTGINKKEKRI